MDNNESRKADARNRLVEDLRFAQRMFGIAPSLAEKERVDEARKALEAFDGAPLPPASASLKLPLGFFR